MARPLSVALVLVCAAGAPAGEGPARPPGDAARASGPNIVLVLADDMEMAALPHMPTVQSQLVARGLSFRNAFVTTPVCAPSRASILTGRYAHNHGVVANRPPAGGYRAFVDGGAERSTVGTWLRARGYRTGFVGKYMNRYPTHRTPAHVPEGWNDWFGIVFPDAYYNYRVNDGGRVIEHGERPEDYLTDVLSERAAAFLRSVDPDRPFFLYLAPLAPHAPAEPAPRHASALPHLTAPKPPSFDEADVSDKPARIRALPRLSPSAIETADALFRRRVQALLAVDEMLARVLEILTSRGLLERTYVVFTSDNGFTLGSHRVPHGKDAYDESLRVPLVVRGPEVPAGAVREHMVLNLDLAPTFADLAGAEVPREVDGRSLAPLLGARPPGLPEWRRDFLVEYFGTGKTAKDGDDDDGGLPAFKGLRTGDRAYVEHETGERELYDVSEDPHQLQSLHATAPPRLVEALRARIEALARCSGSTCRE